MKELDLDRREPDDPHAPTASSVSCFQHDGKAGFPAKGDGVFRVRDWSVRAGDDRHSRLLGGDPGLNLSEGNSQIAL